MPPYRLQTVLEIRERAEEAAKQAFSEAVVALVKEQKELKRLEEELEKKKLERKTKSAAYFKEVMAKGMSGASGMTMMSRFDERLKDEEAQIGLEIERQKEAVKAAETVMETKRLELTEASKDLKAIEKHKDKWKKQIKAERDAREDLAGEEIGNALFLARLRK